jgi:hypothetical protein
MQLRWLQHLQQLSGDGHRHTRSREAVGMAVRAAATPAEQQFMGDAGLDQSCLIGLS